ncbi:MAG TPA: DUF2336 domain-containing protein [Salinarimonas sp.]|nr:DUF2336 domain-containing protein [Salinarimonas sp.]
MRALAPCHPRLRPIVAAVTPRGRAGAALRLATRFDRAMGALEADLYDAAVCELVRHEPAPVRAQVSERIADAPAGPVRCVLLFAHDPAAEVAAPVLARSRLVPDPVLVSLAWTRGQDHLSAIAGRRSLAARVSDAVAARGRGPVLRRLAANAGARLSEEGVDRLACAARGDEVVREALARRGDVPGALRRRLGLAPLAGPAEHDPLTDDLVEAALDWLATLRAGREPREVDVARALREDELARVAALVAHLARDEASETVAAFRARALDALLLLLRVAGIGWPLAERILRRRLGGGAPIGVQQAAYAGLSRRSAERALRALRVGAARAAPAGRA